MGFLHRAIELTGTEVLGYRVLEGFSKGDLRIHYRFRLG